MILATGAVTIGILVVATVVFIVLYGWLTDRTDDPFLTIETWVQ